jgi:hypothetical protein
MGPTTQRVLDKLHHLTVGVLVVSTLYFGVEAFRAGWHIQKHKAEQRVSARRWPDCEFTLKGLF